MCAICVILHHHVVFPPCIVFIKKKTLLSPLCGHLFVHHTTFVCVSHAFCVFTIHLLSFSIRTPNFSLGLFVKYEWSETALCSCRKII